MEQQPEKRKYRVRTAQCTYVDRNGFRCTKMARNVVCCYHNPVTRQKNRELALQAYYRKTEHLFPAQAQ